MQAAWFEKSGISLLDENDSFPRDTSKSILQASLEFVSDKHILSTSDFRYGEHLSVSSDGHGNYAVLLCNAHADARYDISIHFDGNV